MTRARCGSEVSEEYLKVHHGGCVSCRLLPDPGTTGDAEARLHDRYLSGRGCNVPADATAIFVHAIVSRCAQAAKDAGQQVAYDEIMKLVRR